MALLTSGRAVLLYLVFALACTSLTWVRYARLLEAERLAVFASRWEWLFPLRGRWLGLAISAGVLFLLTLAYFGAGALFVRAIFPLADHLLGGR